MTVSLCVILMEMVRTDAVLPFVMVVIIVAKGTADRLSDPFVLRRIKLKRLPFLQRMPHLNNRRGRFTAASVARLRDHPLLPGCPSGHLVAEALRDAPLKEWFVVVRPKEVSEGEAAAAALADAGFGGSGGDTWDASSVGSAPSALRGAGAGGPGSLLSSWGGAAVGAWPPPSPSFSADEPQARALCGGPFVLVVQSLHHHCHHANVCLLFGRSVLPDVNVHALRSAVVTCADASCDCRSTCCWASSAAACSRRGCAGSNPPPPPTPPRGAALRTFQTRGRRRPARGAQSRMRPPRLRWRRRRLGTAAA